ncbi:Hsp70 protein-domain-containing protein [Gautieria morchelliformis]|nr:Hsp70 protein-domain-containing protein [Gautieria morchelliformis]
MGSPTGPNNEETAIIGINFGNSYASIAVITKEGNAECIANEDGERQIAAAISFHDEELARNQATPQLVKNANNTITGFRNLLGKKFSEIPSSGLGPTLAPSAPLIQHPSLPDTPCYAVEVLVPSPAPLISSRSTSTFTPTPPPSSRPSTQHPTPLATPRSEPIRQTRYITPHDAATLFLKSLHQSAADFLGKVPDGAVVTVPSWFTKSQREAVQGAAKEAGINVMEILDEDAAAASVVLDSENDMNQGKSSDRTTLLVDWGSTDLMVSLLSIRAGLVHVLSSKRSPELGTACTGSIDEVLVKHFAKEFAKKTGESLQVCPSNAKSSRAQTKLALALPHVKRSLTTAITSSTLNSSSQSKSTQISIESLHGGLDFSSALNRTRASGLLSGVFTRFAEVVRTVLDSAGGDGEPWAGRGIWVDTVVWVGGGGRLATAGASAALLASGVLGEDVRDEDVGAPEEALARGCALHGRGIEHTPPSLDVDPRDVPVARRTVGIIVPQPLPSEQPPNGNARHAGDSESKDADLGGQWIPVLPAETPLPCRRTIRFPIMSSPSSDSLDRAVFEVWEISEIVRVLRIPQAQLSDASDDEEAPEDIEERERGIRKEQHLGVIEIPLSPSKPAKKAKEPSGRIVQVRFDMDVNGGLEVRAQQGENEWVTMNVASPAT